MIDVIGLSDLDVLAVTAWAEARGDSLEGHSSVEERIAVLCVIRNRVQRRHQDWTQVCLARFQFSCWLDDGSPNARALATLVERVKADTATDPIYLETRYLAAGIMSGVILDRTNGADSYFAPAAMVPPGRVPSWAVGRVPSAEVGRQVFFALEG